VVRDSKYFRVSGSELVFRLSEGAGASREIPGKPISEVAVDFLRPLHVWPVRGWDRHFFQLGNKRHGLYNFRNSGPISDGVLARIDRQGGDIDVEYAAVVGYLPREVTVFMLVELEAISETGLGVLFNQVILFLLRHQEAPGQLDAIIRG